MASTAGEPRCPDAAANPHGGVRAQLPVLMDPQKLYVNMQHTAADRDGTWAITSRP